MVKSNIIWFSGVLSLRFYSLIKWYDHFWQGQWRIRVFWLCKFSCKFSDSVVSICDEFTWIITSDWFTLFSWDFDLWILSSEVAGSAISIWNNSLNLWDQIANFLPFVCCHKYIKFSADLSEPKFVKNNERMRCEVFGGADSNNSWYGFHGIIILKDLFLVGFAKMMR